MNGNIRYANADRLACGRSDRFGRAAGACCHRGRSACFYEHPRRKRTDGKPGRCWRRHSGTTEQGGAEQQGTVFTVTTAGAEQVVYSFAGSKKAGYAPRRRPVASGQEPFRDYEQRRHRLLRPRRRLRDGVQISTSTDKAKTLYLFTGSGGGPNGLIDVSGTFYGTTFGGGTGCGSGGCGTVSASRQPVPSQRLQLRWRYQRRLVSK